MFGWTLGGYKFYKQYLINRFTADCPSRNVLCFVDNLTRGLPGGHSGLVSTTLLWYALHALVNTTISVNMFSKGLY